MTTSSDSTRPDMLHIPAPELESHFKKILLKHSFPEQKAEILARIFMENSLDGVYSHGVNRFPRFIEYVQKGYVKIDQSPVLKSSSGAIEQWDGHLGPGVLNALHSTDRAMHLAQQSGIGCVGLSNTNHWMRGGTYGWKAAKAGYIFIGWTNTTGNMPAWGAVDQKLGNNPLILALPYQEEAIVLDMAMSQYSYGSLENNKINGKPMAFPAGFDQDGQLSKDPAAVLESQRILPVGYWKGAGLSLLLDLLAALLSGGLPTSAISQREAEYGVSQVFIAIDPSKLSNYASIPILVENIIKDYHASTTDSENGKIRYPGEGSLIHRKENKKKGIPVHKKVWEEVLSL